MIVAGGLLGPSPRSDNPLQATSLDTEIESSLSVVIFYFSSYTKPLTDGEAFNDLNS